MEQGSEAESMQAEGSSASSTAVLVREIYKTGWLKQIITNERKPGQQKLTKSDKQWVVMCIHDDVEVFLEWYDNHQGALTHRSLRSSSLLHCLHISPCIVMPGDDFVFAVTLESEVIQLAAATRDQMMEWIDSMRNKLTELGILQPRENTYSKEPEAKPPLAPNRDPMSPLPPTPGFPELPPGTVPTFNREVESEEIHNTTGYTNSPFVPRQTSSLELGDHRNGALELHSTESQPRHNDNAEASVADNNSLEVNATQGLSTNNIPAIEHLNANEILTSPNSFEEVAHMEDVGHITTVSERSDIGAPLPLSSVPANDTDHMLHNPAVPYAFIRRPVRSANPPISSVRHSLPQQPASPDPFSISTPPPLSAPPLASPPMPNGECMFNFDMVSEALEEGVTRVADDYLDSTIYEPLYLARSPAPAARNVTFSRSLSSPNNSSDLWVNPVAESQPQRPCSLKEAQVRQLQREMTHIGGVRLQIRRKDCINSIALVDCLGGVWVAGWKQREHPFLYNSFHIGDQVLRVAGHPVGTSSDAQRALKQAYTPYVEFIIARIPFGKVLAIKRDIDGQDIGLIRENNTAEIRQVLSDGLAAKHGLTARAPTCDGLSFCNWFLTEINGRPLNLFFKEKEVQDRLNAVGKDISILVQPSDFMKTLKKQLKSLRSYKDYIVQ